MTGRFINADTTDVLTVSPTALTDKNLYAYCDNNPVVRRDESGAIWETVFDIISLGASIMDVAANPKDPWAWAGLIGDAIDLIPVVTGAGEVIRGLKTVNKIDDISDAAKIANRTENVSDVINGACFIAGTLVLTSKGYVPIENIDAGDKVWAENPETGEKELKEVVQTFVNETDELVHVFVDGEEIVTTPEHPFYAPCKGWTEAIQLRAGDILVLQSGEYVIVEKVQHEILEAPITVYNFEVEDFHTYYVCESSVLVHNMCNMSVVPTIELTPTHALTNSRSQMRKLVEDIKINGIKEPVKYVSLNGSKYIVDGHHRVEAAKRLNIYKVPAIEVKLPYKGYKTTKDLFWW